MNDYLLIDESAINTAFKWGTICAGAADPLLNKVDIK
jgi:hypothetical protein